ncbi:hypothetical protein ACQY0O_004761 [Thecaphora frezii]
MPIVHIVLVKVKDAVIHNGFEEFKDKCNQLKHVPVAAQKLKEHKWGPPAYTGRTQGYNWGLYSLFATREDYEVYRDDEEHKNFSKTVILPNADEVLAYDFEI